MSNKLREHKLRSLTTAVLLALWVAPGLAAAASDEDFAVRPSFDGDDQSISQDPYRQREPESPRRPSNALKQDYKEFRQEDLDYGDAFARRRPRWGMELRLGPYRPQFSSSAAGMRAVSAMYPRRGGAFAGRPLLVAAEAEYYVLRAFGLLGPYARLGLWQASAPTRVCLAPGTQNVVACDNSNLSSSTPGNDTQSLLALPISFGAVWRLDFLRRHTKVPLTFSAKAGLDSFLWWGSSAGKAARYKGRSAHGSTWGYTLAVGASLGLDALTHHTLGAANSRFESNLFAEYALVRGSALFGRNRANRIDFTDNTLVSIGLAVDFR